MNCRPWQPNWRPWWPPVPAATIGRRIAIEHLLPQLVEMAKQLKRDRPKWKFKYRNMEVIDLGDGRYSVRGWWTTAGSTM